MLTFESRISQHLAAASPRDDSTHSAFLWRYLQPRYLWLRQRSSGGGSTKAAITCQMLQSMLVVRPPLCEQVAVTDYLERALRDSDRLATATLDGIRLLREYRSALVTAAVTGQIDVRTYRREAS